MFRRTCNDQVNFPGHTVKPVLKATCIKQLPVFKDQFFRSHKGRISVILSVLSKHLS